MKPQRLVVGLTGGIGTGKSSALAEFERLGAATVSLDEIARKQAQPGRASYRAILRAFGRSILTKNEIIDRRLLGEMVFNDEAARRGLEKATHPFILREMERLIRRMKGVVVVDVPLLFEKNLQKRFDATLLIFCRPERQIRRIVRRDGLARAEARRRIEAQWSLAKKRALADIVINNDADLRQLHSYVRSYYAGLQLLYGGTPNGNTD